MNGTALHMPVMRASILQEVRLRMRRGSTLAALLAVIAITWLAIPDPSTGMALMGVDKARMLYDSMTLSLGSAALLNLLFGLGGFYLVRGRVAEDLRHGIGGVIGSTPAGDLALLVGRWLGAMAYLLTLAGAFMATVLVLHLLRGEAPIEPATYVVNYMLMLLPALSFAAGMAILCESAGPLVGKAGDVLYFFMWMMQFAAISAIGEAQDQVWHPLMLVDFNGAPTMIVAMVRVFGTPHLNIGLSDFDASLPLVTMPADFWTPAMIATRIGATLIGMLPALAAAVVFHRFSPDRVRAAHGRKRGSPLALADRLLRPLARLVTPLHGPAAGLPAPLRGIAADMLLTLSARPALIVAMAAAIVAGIAASAPSLAGVALAATIFWGVAISDVAVRDHAADLGPMGAAVAGGALARTLRQFAATLLLGWIMLAPVGLRWLEMSPVRGAAVFVGIFAMSACAQAFGVLTRTGRAFLALFLFAMYVSTQVRNVAWLDMVGVNGVADSASVLAMAMVGIAALAVAVAATLRGR